MINFDNLSIINDKNDFDLYLKNNIHSIFDHLNSSYIELKTIKIIIRRLITQKYQIFSELDFSKSYNTAFILLLFDYTERFKLISPARLLLNIVETNRLSIGQRLEAAKLFLFTRHTSEYLEELNNIFDKLDYAYQNEEDNEIKTLLTLSNYISLVFDNVGEQKKEIVISLIASIKHIKSKFAFLNFDFVDSLLAIDISNFEEGQKKYQILIDSLLDRKQNALVNSSLSLIEIDTDYVNLLATVRISFDAIQNLSQIEYRKIADNSIFNSLQRGVGILTEKEQLLSYMNSYGKMHYAKLQSAFNELPESLFSQKIDIIDWACGQGLASISYFDFLNLKNKTKNIEKITLIEPSEIALKRAALHIRKFDANITVFTINKELDAIDKKDFSLDNVKLHLFSNILDIDFFSMTNLLNNISDNNKGINYFVCVSPYITVLKKNRIDSFVDFFRKYDSFQLIKSFDNPSNNWCSYGNQSWSRVLRIFKVNIL